MTSTPSCIAVSSDFLDAGEREAVLEEYAPVFEKAGVSLLAAGDEPVAGADLGGSRAADVGSPGGMPSGPLVVFVVTGGTERQVMELVDARQGAGARSGRDDEASRRGASRHAPVLLVAYPGGNSLPASLEVLARLQQDGVPGRIVFFNGPVDFVGAARLRVLVSDASSEAVEEAGVVGGRALEPARRLSGRRMGVVGAPSDWLVASSPPPDVVRDAWGVDVVQIGMNVFAASRSPGTLEALAGSFREAASEVREPGDDDLLASAGVYLALRSLVDELRLDAVTVRCFDLVTGPGSTGCLALSRLADEGVVAGCEGDVVSALGMLWVRERLGQVSWMANPARIDAAANSLWLAHCTVPGCMVSEYALRSHFESGLGAAVEGSIPYGPVTLLRIGGRDLDRLWVAEGEIVSHGTDDTMCRTQVEVRLREAARVSDLLERPLGNHLILTAGWVADAICTGL